MASRTFVDGSALRTDSTICCFLIALVLCEAEYRSRNCFEWKIAAAVECFLLAGADLMAAASES